MSANDPKRTLAGFTRLGTIEEKTESALGVIIKRGSDWVPLRGVDQRRLIEARLQTHHAVQWLARAARAYVPPQPEDGHTNLSWDRALGGFSTHPFKNGAWLSLKITDLTIALHVGKGSGLIQSFSIGGRPDAQVQQWLSEQLDGHGFNLQALNVPSPYEIAAHAISQGAAYDLAGLTDALIELAAWFDNAELSVGSIRRQMIGRKLMASPVRCWPHHFDLATLITLPTRNAEANGSVGVGLSPGDEHYDEPYFYVSAYPEPNVLALPNLAALGHWHLHDFTAAIAPAHKIVVAKNQQAETDDFLQAAVDGAIKILS
jgi:Family of unknown function (DUF5996)